MTDKLSRKEIEYLLARGKDITFSLWLNAISLVLCIIFFFLIITILIGIYNIIRLYMINKELREIHWKLLDY